MTPLRQRELTTAAQLQSIKPLRHKKRARYVIKPFGNRFLVWDTARACVPFQYVNGFDSPAHAEEVAAKLSQFSEN